MFNHSTRVVLASMFALAGVIANASAASASSSTPATSLGYDISFPQCSSTLPSGVGFGVVGVNFGHPYSLNPCLARELQWAQHTLTASPEFYANTDNPGPTNNPHWPTLQQTPQVCFGANSVACSYDYGWNAARVSFHNAVGAETKVGTASPAQAASHARWWLDVESGNAWETIRTANGPTSASFANDDAVIQGQLAYLASVGVTSVGVYSTRSQWIGLMGVTGSTFVATKAWLTGYGSLATAKAACASASFTGGRVAMIQYPSIGLDGDYQCPLLSGPTASSVSVAGSATFSDQLAVAGESAPVTYVQGTGAPSLNVSSTGLVTTSGPLPAGTYSATGTTSVNGDTGTFIFSLTVGTLVQNPPTSTSVSVATAVTFTDQLSVTASSGAVTYTQGTGAPALVVSPTGLISTSGTLGPGSYVVRGTMSDTSGDQGTFFFNLKVGAITQNPPESATATPVTSTTFTDQLSVTASSGTVTYTQSTGAPALVVSPTGLVSTSGTLAIGSYVVRGTMSDASGDQGTFFFNLRVGPAGTITQGSPTTARTTATATATYTAQLAVSGNSGNVTYTQGTGTPALVVSPTGLVSTSGTLAVGSYVARGTTSDASGDQGTFAFILHVGPTTPAPKPKVVSPVAHRVVGHAVAGRTVTLRVVGLGFFGRPTVIGRAGTTAVVTHDSGRMLTLRVRVQPRSRNGVFTFVIAMSNGKLCTVRYVQR